jgi:hypothetical protein
VPIATAKLMQAVADGELTPSEARDVSVAVGVHVEAIKAVDLDQRLARIEEAMGNVL